MAHPEGAKIFCDVTNPHHALRAQDAGVDGVIAVASGAGGHAGPIDMMALIPMLTEALSIPVLAAGSIMDGRGLAAALSLGAVAGYMGSRFIAADESGAAEDYKELTVKSNYTDTEMSPEISGLPCRYFKACIDKFKNHPGEFRLSPHFPNLGDRFSPTPGRSTVRPTHSHSPAKMRSRSRDNTAGSVYAPGGNSAARAGGNRACAASWANSSSIRVAVIDCGRYPPLRRWRSLRRWRCR